MDGMKKPFIERQSSYNSLYSNPLIDPKNSKNSSEEHPDVNVGNPTVVIPLGNHLSLNNNILNSKENNPFVKNKKVSNFRVDDKENLVPKEAKGLGIGNKKNPDGNSLQNSKERVLKPSSLQLCIQMNEPDSSFGLGFKVWNAAEETESAKSVNIWDFSDSEAAPASSWSTLPNRALLSKPLPMDVGRCACIILKEAAPRGFGGGSLYSLYTNEGKGRQNRKLAVAYHKRRSGRSIFVIAQNTKGVFSTSDDSFIGLVTSNLMGSRYYVWNKGLSPRKPVEESKLLQAIVEFTPTISTWTGRYRSLRAWISKQTQPVQSKNTSNQVQHMKTLPSKWEGKMDKDQVHLFESKVPHYNKVSKQYELDFREKVRAGLRIQSSVKNFQLTMEGNEGQIVLQLGRLGKSKFVMDYRHPMTGYQAFCISLAAIDPKLCCTV
ncbi:tubby-like protein 8 [Amaranthus tricolor]|uniref:tubby-like protein 8 n=1 Tax=Amaranthus tricolor TaxID=29722 RepID=UPI00258A8A01|nr:tubby-like protein 8 [Amaranthus tricolor]